MRNLSNLEGVFVERVQIKSINIPISLDNSKSTKNDILRQSIYFYISKVYIVSPKEYKIYICKDLFGGSN